MSYICLEKNRKHVNGKTKYIHHYLPHVQILDIAEPDDDAKRLTYNPTWGNTTFSHMTPSTISVFIYYKLPSFCEGDLLLRIFSEYVSSHHITHIPLH